MPSFLVPTLALARFHDDTITTRNMSTYSRLSLVSLLAFILCCSLGEGRHIHHHAAHHLQRRHLHHRHDHHARQVYTASASPIFATVSSPAPTVEEAPLPSITAADAVSDDLDQIQTGMNNFTSDLSAFFRAIQEWLKAFRALLENDVDSPPTTAEPAPELGPEIPTSIPDVKASDSITFHEPVPVLTAAPSAPSAATSTLCRPAAGAGPLVPCPEEAATSTGFLTVTSTSTRSNTITTYATVSYANVSAPANGTAVPKLPTAVLNSFAVVPTPPLTPSVTLVSSVTSVTISGSIYTSATATYAVSPSPPPYTFNATSSDNVAVYYGKNLG